MQFGITENGNRTRPTYSGQKAICQLCNSSLVGKCGEIYAWHWQHSKDRECDPWKEHETAWHRDWKKHFPENWQEVIIEKFGEKHIADIKTAKGLVIEFQNSSISTSTIRTREEFYENIISYSKILSYFCTSKKQYNCCEKNWRISFNPYIAIPYFWESSDIYPI